MHPFSSLMKSLSANESSFLREAKVLASGGYSGVDLLPELLICLVLRKIEFYCYVRRAPTAKQRVDATYD